MELNTAKNLVTKQENQLPSPFPAGYFLHKTQQLGILSSYGQLGILYTLLKCACSFSQVNLVKGGVGKLHKSKQLHMLARHG